MGINVMGILDFNIDFLVSTGLQPDGTFPSIGVDKSEPDFGTSAGFPPYIPGTMETSKLDSFKPRLEEVDGIVVFNSDWLESSIRRDRHRGAIDSSALPLTISDRLLVEDILREILRVASVVKISNEPL
jgi:hypothetical protein